jgi:hypothetical protein
LIELSIVLVIIGLIVGGVLVGQELIKASEARNFISTMQSFKNAFYTFQGKYNCLPGDCGNATTFFGTAAPSGCSAGTTGPPLAGNTSGTCNGNNNGQIDLSDGAGHYIESPLVWQHLGLASMIPGSYSGMWGGGSPLQPGVNFPGGLYQQIYLIEFVTSVWGFGSITPGHYGVLQGINPDQYDLTNSLPTWMAHRIDLKIDDGMPGTGSVISAGSYCNSNNTPQTAVYQDSAPSEYNEGCVLYYRF